MVKDNALDTSLASLVMDTTNHLSSLAKEFSSASSLVLCLMVQVSSLLQLAQLPMELYKKMSFPSTSTPPVQPLHTIHMP